MDNKRKVIRVNQIKINIQDVHNETATKGKQDRESYNLQSDIALKKLPVILSERINKLFNPKNSYDIHCEIIKKSIDSRKKPDIFMVYSIDILSVRDKNKKEIPLNKFLKTINVQLQKKHNIIFTDRVEYSFIRLCKNTYNLTESKRPVVIGFGPAGMFAMLKLSEAGLRPVCYERGEKVDERQLSVERFWQTGELNPESNVQFGEGGAGTFSDGKLNTVIKDSTGRIREVLKTFVRFGAPDEILYNNKPHIGTDVLREVVKNIREYILTQGGEIFFNTRLEDIELKDNHVQTIILKDNITGKLTKRECENICLAIGHSSRDTVDKMLRLGCIVEPKAFAVGLRMEHPQRLIDENAYGSCKYNMPTADYKVTYQTQSGRGVYSFCMCPGGWVVNASSEKERLCVNGMSYSKRDGDNANSAIIVTVTPQDFGNSPLAGIAFQRKLEHAAYNEGKGAVPVQLLGDFKNNYVSTGFGIVKPSIKGSYTFGNLNNILPQELSDAIKESMSGFDRIIKGFDMDEAVLAGVESRTSSPVRLVRNETLEANIYGIFPCGEGAGYAGGITSAAVDGIKVAERIAEKIDDILE